VNATICRDFSPMPIAANRLTPSADSIWRRRLVAERAVDVPLSISSRIGG
jgi:hypothetical protein